MGTRCSDLKDPNDHKPVLTTANHCAGVSRGDCLGFKNCYRKSEETDPRVLSLNVYSSSCASKRCFMFVIGSTQFLSELVRSTTTIPAVRLVSSSAVRGRPRVSGSDTDPARFSNVCCAHEAAGHWVLGERQFMADSAHKRMPPRLLRFYLLPDLRGVIDLDPQVSDGTLQLGLARK